MPLAVAAITVGGIYIYRYQEELKAELPATPPRFAKNEFKNEEGRKDWEKYLPISEKHRKPAKEEAAIEPTPEISIVESSPEVTSEEPITIAEPLETAVVEEPVNIIEPILEESVIENAVEEAFSSVTSIAEEVVETIENVFEVETESHVTDSEPVETIQSDPVAEIETTNEESEITPPIEIVETAADEVVIAVEEEEASPIVEETPVVDVMVEQMAALSRDASSNTADAIEAINRARTAVSHLMAAKRVALGIDGDPDTRAAFWLKVTDAQRRLQTATADVGTSTKKAEDAIAACEEIAAENPDSAIVLISDIAGMKQEYASAHDTLAEANAQLDKFVQLESELVAELQAKKEKHLESLPEIAGGDDWRTLNTAFTDEDLKGLIFIAQRKLEAVARELRELKTVQSDEVEKALSSQRAELLLKAENELAELKEKQQEMIASKKEELFEELKNEFEEDLKLQLKRQSAAHAEHLVDELERQAAQQTAEAELKLTEEIDSLSSKYIDTINSERVAMTASLEEEQAKYNLTLQQLLGFADGVNLTLSEREQTELEVTKHQCVLLAVEEMHDAVFGKSVRPLSNVAANFKAFAIDDPAVNAVIDALPPLAIEKGVLSPKSLEATLPALIEKGKENFMVGDDAHGLFARMRSKLNATCLFTKWSDPAPLPDGADLTGNVDKIVSAATYYMEEGDLESTVRVLNQLSGEPRRILSQWIQEARLSLEVIQALDALTAISQARILSARSYS